MSDPTVHNRLGGPPGLFDGPNLDRNSEGGIVQRIRVPASTEPDQFFTMGRLQTDSLNDSDQVAAVAGVVPTKPSKPSKADMAAGIPFAKSITGSKL